MIASCDDPMVENPVKNNKDPLVDHHQRQYWLGRHLFISAGLDFNLVSIIPEAKTSSEPRGLVNRQIHLSPNIVERFREVDHAVWDLSAHSSERFGDSVFGCFCLRHLLTLWRTRGCVRLPPGGAQEQPALFDLYKYKYIHKDEYKYKYKYTYKYKYAPPTRWRARAARLVWYTTSRNVWSLPQEPE